MTAAYATLANVKSRLTGDIPQLGPNFDQTLADKIGEASADIDRKMRRARGIAGGWSFLADSSYEVQCISLSAFPTGGTFDLTFGASSVTLDYGATAAQVQSALEGLAGIGAGNVTVTGRAGGPWTATWGGTRSGPQPLLVATASLVPANSVVAVQELVQGVAVVPSARSFALTAAPWDTWMIDDCVSIESVSYFGSPGASAQLLTPGTDYLTAPMTGVPIVALRKVNGRWPPRAQIIVSATWGFGTVIPLDVREVAIIETIRSYLGDRAGNDDRLGMTPFGAVTYTKAFTSKMTQLIEDYTFGGVLRR